MAFFAILADKVSRFDADELRAAAHRLIETHRSTTFPPIAICLEAAEAARKAESEKRAALAEQARAVAIEAEKRSEAERHAEAVRICRSEIGRRALREGWLIGLFDFVTVHQSEPDEARCDEIRAAAAKYGAAPKDGFMRPLYEARRVRGERIAAEIFPAEMEAA